MSQDTVDLLKVMIVGALLMAFGSAALLGVAQLATNLGLSIEWIATFGGLDPAEMIGRLADTRPLVLFGSAFLAAAGLSLLLTSATLDMGVLLLAKSVAVLVSGSLGIIAGVWLFLRLAYGDEVPLPGLNRLAIVLALSFAFATLANNANLRRTGIGRIPIALAMLIVSPVVLSSF